MWDLVTRKAIWTESEVYSRNYIVCGSLGLSMRTLNLELYQILWKDIFFHKMNWSWVTSSCVNLDLELMHLSWKKKKTDKNINRVSIDGKIKSDF